MSLGVLFFQHDIKRSINLGEERFNQLSLEERGKFDEETLVNVNNLRKRMMGAPKAQRFNNEYIVVSSWTSEMLFLHNLNCQYTLNSFAFEWITGE